MNAVTEDGSKGSYIGQHKIGHKCPLNDGYKGSGKQWKKYILQRNVPTEKVILRMCDSLEDANYWEKFYIKQAKEDGIYLWNRCKGGGGYEHDKKYTIQELAEHKKEYMKEYRDTNKEKIAEYMKEYRDSNREKIAEQRRQYMKEYMKQYRDAQKEKIAKQHKQYDNQPCLYNGETLTLNALSKRFRKAGITSPTTEAKKYLIV